MAPQEEGPAPGEWQVIDQILDFFADSEEEPTVSPEEVIPLLEALRQAIAAVQRRPLVLQRVERECKERAAQEEASACDLRARIQELQSITRENELMRTELQRVRTALDKARGQQAQIQVAIDKGSGCSGMRTPNTEPYGSRQRRLSNTCNGVTELCKTAPNMFDQESDMRPPMTYLEIPTEVDLKPPATYLEMPPELCGTAPNLLAQARMAQDTQLSATVFLRPSHFAHA
mmetsp:Transcript_73260/g.166049  ORF Transcript_73260/g.166049 Transcript_73260/m.166049 type:complete len:231 (-) Transcript_73260:92-784(-)